MEDTEPRCIFDLAEVLLQKFKKITDNFQIEGYSREEYLKYKELLHKFDYDLK